MPAQRGGWLVWVTLLVVAVLAFTLTLEGTLLAPQAPAHLGKHLHTFIQKFLLIATFLGPAAAVVDWLLLRRPVAWFEGANDQLAYQERGGRRVELRSRDVTEAWLVSLGDQRWGLEVKTNKGEVLLGALGEDTDPLALLDSIGSPRPRIKAVRMGAPRLMRPFYACVIAIIPSGIAWLVGAPAPIPMALLAIGYLSSLWVIRNRRILVGDDGLGFDGTLRFGFTPWNSIRSPRIAIERIYKAGRVRDADVIAPVLYFTTTRGEQRLVLTRLSHKQAELLCASMELHTGGARVPEVVG